jgi:hypothetical protein
MGIIDRAAACCLSIALLLAGGCAARTGGPQVVSTADTRTAPVRTGARIGDYYTALASIAAIMERDLALPPITVQLRFYTNRDAFRAALEGEAGYEPSLARDASQLDGVAGFRRILINDTALRWMEWPPRVSFLAHELTHTVQYELTGGVRGTSDQWVREGFADWVKVYVLDALELTRRDAARTLAISRVRDASRRQTLPALQDLVTFPDWVRAVQTFGPDATYSQALLAAEILVERHGVPAIVDYFRLFGASEDRVGNFRTAFGEEPAQFAAAFAGRVERLR